MLGPDHDQEVTCLQRAAAEVRGGNRHWCLPHYRNLQELHYRNL